MEQPAPQGVADPHATAERSRYLALTSMAQHLQAQGNGFDRFLDWFERHKFGVIGTLLLHTVIMFVLAISQIRTDPKPETVAETELEVLPALSDQEFEKLQQQLATSAGPTELSEVKSMVSNITAHRVIENAWPSQATQQRMAEAIEQDLKAFEQAEFDRLAQERHERGEDVVMPQLDPSKWNKELYMEKAAEPAKVQGNAAVWHDLKDRVEQRLDVPAFTCKGQGQVAVSVSVDREGTVQRTEVDAANTTTSDACMIERALGSASSARFNGAPGAPQPQRGTIFYLFVAQ